VARAKVRKDSTVKAVTEFLQQVREMKAKAVTPDELAKAKQHMKMAQWQHFETSSSMVTELSDTFIFDLPATFRTGKPAKIDAVSQADVSHMVDKYLDPDHMAVIVIGDRKAIESDLGKIGLGKPILLKYTSGDLKF
jgi:predicted Zn-dependent peptidase